MSAQVGGRSLVVSWIIGVLCAGVIGALVWFALPAAGLLAEMVGQVLRGTAG